MIALAEQDRLALEAELAEIVATLMDGQDDDGAGSLAHSTLQTYAKQIGNFGQRAQAYGLNGLSQICQVLQQRLESRQEPAENLALRELLEEWPILAMGYLSDPADEQHAIILLGNLQAPAWGEYLPEAVLHDIQRAFEETDLTPDVSLSLDTLPPASRMNDQADALFTSGADDQAEFLSDLAKTDHSLRSEDFADRAINADTTASLQSDIASLLDILAPALDDTSPATLNPIPSRFAEQLQVIGTDAAEAGVIGFCDLCLLFSEQLQQISQRDDNCTPDELALLEEWPTLAMLYLENPQDPMNAQALLEHMSNPAWRVPLTDEEVQILRDLLSQAPVIADQAQTDATTLQAAYEALPAPPIAAIPDEAPLWTDAGSARDAGVESTIETSNASAAHMPSSTDDASAVSAQTRPGEASDPAATVESTLDVSAAFEIKTPPQLADNTPTAQDESLGVLDSTTANALQSEAHERPEVISADLPETVSEPPIDVSSQLPVGFDVSEPSALAATGLRAEGSDESTVTISDDLLDILRAELAEIAEAGAQSLGLVQDTASSDEQRRQALEDYTEELERLSMAADSIGLQGLAQLCAQLHANLDAFAARQQVLSGVECHLLNDWQQPVLAYLEAIGAEQPSQDLIAFLQQPDWLLPLDDETAAELLQALRNPAPSLEDFGEVEERQTTARPVDISLELPPDTNQELVDSLLQELPNQTSDFTAAIQKLYEGQGSIADMESAQRIAHTLKGAGNTVGVAGIANITHHIEDILIALGKEHSMPTRNLAGTLMDAADCLETMSESLLGMSEPPPQAQAVLQSILDLANRIDHEGVPSVLAGDSTIKPADFSTLNQAEPTTAAESAATTETAASSHEETAPVPMVRVPAPLIDELLRLVGESIILTGQIQERIRANMTQARLIRLQNQTLQQLVNELEQLVDVQSVGMPTLPTGNSGAASQFDPLEMDQYNELHTVTRRLVEAAADAHALDEGISDNFAELETLMSDQTQVHRDSQEAVMRTRMVPIQTVVPRLQRTVRQTGRLTDKEVELSVKGSNTMIDSNVLGDMLDPLMHVLRNAIDHGIEAPDIRQARKKPATGQIQLGFQREGNSIVVRCKDDGGGLNLDGIRTTAEQRGLVLPGQTLSEDELARLILQPGFSTRTQATQVSGRGIGLDAVYSEVLKLKGSLTIQSQTGLGCTIEMRLPITLISAHALLVRCNQDIFAVAERGIEQLVHATTGQVLKTDSGLAYELEGQQFDIIQLESLLGLPVSDDEATLMQRPALLARDETGNIKAIMVEEMIDSRDLVVKPMGHFAPKIKGILGATILGDGSITPVLDMPELLRGKIASNRMAGATTPSIARPAVAPAPSKPKVLVVDDSLSVRRTMQQLISDAGFDVLTARDGLEAVSILNSDKPSIMLVDMEMPRMNGLELTMHARAQASTRDLPIIMITSRSTTKHRQEAEAAGVSAYLTKPIADDDLISYLNQMVAAV